MYIISVIISSGKNVIGPDYCQIYGRNVGISKVFFLISIAVRYSLHYSLPDRYLTTFLLNLLDWCIKICVSSKSNVSESNTACWAHVTTWDGYVSLTLFFKRFEYREVHPM